MLTDIKANVFYALNDQSDLQKYLNMTKPYFDLISSGHVTYERH